VQKGKEDSCSLSAAELLELLEGDYKMENDTQSGTVTDEVGGWQEPAWGYKGFASILHVSRVIIVWQASLC
jgi:hypothetical protein